MYFHRIGRTARAGATGKAISLVSQDRVNDFSRILKKTKQPILRLNEGMGITIPIVKQHPMIDINKDAVIGIKVAATEMEVMVMGIAVVIETINGALENTELI